MNKLNSIIRAYFFPIIVIAINVINTLYIVHNSTPVEHIDYVSLITEAFVAALPLYGIFISNKLLKEEPYVFIPLFSGLSLLSISTITDTLDELFDEPVIENIIFEQLCEVIGLFLIIFSLTRWLKFMHTLNSKLYELAHTDDLTDIANRRHFIATLDNEIARAKRYSNTLSIITIDIDHFKVINDTYGHDMGDKILQNVCKVFKTQVRQSDLLARTGGEEFAILLINTDIRKANIVAEHCRHALISDEHLKTFQITASFGVAQFSENQTIEDLLKKADTALYQAKTNGRNTVVLAS